MAGGSRRAGFDLRGEGGNLRLVLQSSEKGGALPAGARTFLEKAAPILKSAGIIVDLKGEGWAPSDIIQVMKFVISPSEASVCAWTADDPLVLEWMERTGLKLYSRPLPEDEKAAPEDLSLPVLLVHGSLRSGRKIEHGGDVIVLGNINGGAEVIASGSIVVTGRLKGLVHAGLDSEEEAFIVAGCFEANQVRIGGKISYLEEPCPWRGKTVSMKIRSGSIEVRESSE